MPDLRIDRDHTLGLPRAREVAHAWTREATEKFGMACHYEQDEAVDRVRFERPGVSGELRVTASRFELEARLGFLLGAFQSRIEQEISRNLDALLAG